MFELEILIKDENMIGKYRSMTCTVKCFLSTSITFRQNKQNVKNNS